MTKKRAVLAWECGAGRGHVTKLKMVAQALRDHFDFYAVLHQMAVANEVEDICDAVFPCESLPIVQAEIEARRGHNAATWAEYLAQRGFCNVAFLKTRVEAWRKALTLFETDVLIADYAPAAMLAARSLGIPTIVLGTGYGIPPRGTPQFAIFIEEYAHRHVDEVRMCAAMNEALAVYDAPPLAVAPDLYDVALQLVTTLPELDPYADRPDGRLPSGDDVSSFIADGTGDEVFIYFSTSERQNPALMQAVKQLGVPTRAFMPGASEAELAAMAAAGVMIERKPVPVDLLAKRTRLMVHAGQHGILNLALAAGIAQLAVPQHLEHTFHALRAERLGVLKIVQPRDVEVESFVALVRGLYEDVAMHRAAQAFATEKRAYYGQDIAALIREKCRAIL